VVIVLETKVPARVCTSLDARPGSARTALAVAGEQQPCGVRGGIALVLEILGVELEKARL
jgi:hypothetical protein